MKTTLRRRNVRNLPPQTMMTAIEIIFAVRRGASIRIPAVLWREFCHECAIRCGDCSDIFAAIDMANGSLVLSRA